MFFSGSDHVNWASMDCLRRTHLFLRRNLTVEPVLFFFMLGSYLEYLALQQLLYEKVCIKEIDNATICKNLSAYKDEEKTVQTSVSYWLMLLNVALTVPSCISTLVLGAWTDKVGRRVAMVLPSLGSVLNGICLIFSAVYMDLTIGIMILGSVLLGIVGAYPTLTAAVFSYLGDITKEQTRTKRFGILEGMTFGGSFVGQLTCGIVIDHLGYTAVFIYYIICNAVVILYVLLWLRESAQHARSDVSETHARSDVSATNVLKDDALHTCSTDEDGASLNEYEGWSCSRSCIQLFHLGNLVKSFVTVGRERPNRQRLQLILLLCCLFTFQLVGTGTQMNLFDQCQGFLPRSCIFYFFCMRYILESSVLF